MTSRSGSAEAATTGQPNEVGSSTAREVRDLVGQHGRLSVSIDDLTDSTDLHSAGLTSLATVSLMLALEEHFGIEFPDRLLGRRTFSSIDALAAAVDGLRAPDGGK